MVACLLLEMTASVLFAVCLAARLMGADLANVVKETKKRYYL
jgi:hypothetical protein